MQQSIFDFLGLSDTKGAVWQLYVDGACRGNPGVSGIGVFILKDGKQTFKKGFFVGHKTNNEAEYLALLMGLYTIHVQMDAHDRVKVVSDSQLLIRQMTGEYRVKNESLKKMHGVATQLMQGKSVSYEHVLREYNTQADQLANDGVDTKKSLPIKFLDFLQAHEVFL